MIVEEVTRCAYVVDGKDRKIWPERIRKRLPRLLHNPKSWKASLLSARVSNRRDSRVDWRASRTEMRRVYVYLSASAERCLGSRRRGRNCQVLEFCSECPITRRALDHGRMLRARLEQLAQAQVSQLPISQLPIYRNWRRFRAGPKTSDRARATRRAASGWARSG